MNFYIKNIPNLAQQSLHYCSRNYCIDCSRFHCSSFSRNHCTSCSCLQAWTISTAAYYKAGGKPWKLGDIRPGVCYLGLVYKKIEKSKNPKNACCAAQMFLDNGDGTVFKGEVGPWYNPEKGEYH